MASLNDIVVSPLNAFTFNNFFEEKITLHTSSFDLSGAERNAVKHAAVSALYTDVFGSFVARQLGDVNEVFQDFLGRGSILDDHKDFANNAIGRRLATEYPDLDATDYYQTLARLAKDGLLITDENFQLDTSDSDPFTTNTIDEQYDELYERAKRHLEDNNLEPQPRFCFLAGTPIDMWPTDLSIKPDENGLYNQEEVIAAIWRKPIEEVTPDDWVVSPDKDGNLKPGKVTRTFQNTSKHILNVHGMMVTPGHATLCADGRFAGRYVPIIDILRSDGAMMKLDGTKVRAATGSVVGSKDDELIHAVTGERMGGGMVVPREQGQIRAGTRFIMDDGKDYSVLDSIKAFGAHVTEDGYIQKKQGGEKMPFLWRYTDRLPKPEDYILQRSQVTLEEIYQVDEWEAVGPQIPAPAVVNNNPIVKDPAIVNAMPPNIPLGMETSPNKPTITRKQRRAFEAKQRKAAKTNKASRMLVN